jgi:DeoR family transcriptional regulator of aga operon
MRQSERLSRIVQQLSTNGSVGVGDLAADLGVSSATVRRDLVLLEQQRLLARTHGGAIANGVLFELPLRYRSARRQEQKARIAKVAAERVPEGAAIGMTGGTTTTEAARALSDRRRLTVVTNSLNIASELAVRPNLKLVVTGGPSPTSWWVRWPRRRCRASTSTSCWWAWTASPWAPASPPTTRSRHTPTGR